jgi:hypothetical protein
MRNTLFNYRIILFLFPTERERIVLLILFVGNTLDYMWRFSVILFFMSLYIDCGNDARLNQVYLSVGLFAVRYIQTVI